MSRFCPIINFARGGAAVGLAVDESLCPRPTDQLAQARAEPRRSHA